MRGLSSSQIQNIQTIWYFLFITMFILFANIFISYKLNSFWRFKVWEYYFKKSFLYYLYLFKRRILPPFPIRPNPTEKEYNFNKIDPHHQMISNGFENDIRLSYIEHTWIFATWKWFHLLANKFERNIWIILSKYSDVNSLHPSFLFKPLA